MTLTQQHRAANADRTATSVRARWTLLAASALLVMILVGLPNAFGSGGAHPSTLVGPDHGGLTSAAPAAATLATTAPIGAPSATPTTAAGVFNPPCYKIDVGVCVSICNANESDIIPNVGSFISQVEPNATTDLCLNIKSQTQLDWPYAAHSGQKSPILLNVSGVLWNGDPYYSLNDGDYWHSDNPTTVWTGPTQVPTNKSGYVWWYQVTISAKSSSGSPNFYPGETVNWWIELTFNESGTYIHRESPHFQFTFSGAWPYSPYPAPRSTPAPRRRSRTSRSRLRRGRRTGTIRSRSSSTRRRPTR